MASKFGSTVADPIKHRSVQTTYWIGSINKKCKAYQRQLPYADASCASHGDPRDPLFLYLAATDLAQIAAHDALDASAADLLVVGAREDLGVASLSLVCPALGLLGADAVQAGQTGDLAEPAADEDVLELFHATGGKDLTHGAWVELVLHLAVALVAGVGGVVLEGFAVFEVGETELLAPFVDGGHVTRASISWRGRGGLLRLRGGLHRFRGNICRLWLLWLRGSSGLRLLGLHGGVDDRRRGRGSGLLRLRLGCVGLLRRRTGLGDDNSVQLGRVNDVRLSTAIGPGSGKSRASKGKERKGGDGVHVESWYDGFDFFELRR